VPLPPAPAPPPDARTHPIDDPRFQVCVTSEQEAAWKVGALLACWPAVPLREGHCCLVWHGAPCSACAEAHKSGHN